MKILFFSNLNKFLILKRNLIIFLLFLTFFVELFSFSSTPNTTSSTTSSNSTSNASNSTLSSGSNSTLDDELALAIKITQEELDSLEKLIQLEKQKLETLWKANELQKSNPQANIKFNVPFTQTQQSQQHQQQQYESSDSRSSTSQSQQQYQQSSNAGQTVKQPQHVYKDELSSTDGRGFDLVFKSNINQERVYGLTTLWVRAYNEFCVVVSFSKSICVFNEMGRKIVCIDTQNDDSNPIIKFIPSYKAKDDISLVCQTLNGEVDLYVFTSKKMEHSEVEQVYLNFDQKLQLSLPATSIEISSGASPNVLVSDASGSISIYTPDGKLKQAIKLDPNPITHLSRKGRRLAFVTNTTIGFLDLALMKESSISCEWIAPIGEVLFDSGRMTQTLYAVTNGSLLIFDSQLKTSNKYLECALIAEIPTHKPAVSLFSTPEHLLLLDTEHLSIFNLSMKSVPTLAVRLPLKTMLKSTQYVSPMIHMIRNSGAISLGSDITLFEIPVASSNSSFDSWISLLYHPILIVFAVGFFSWRLYSSISSRSEERKKKKKVL